MSIQLKLDGKAVASLFPEGSEARIQLSNAVVAEVLSKHLKPQYIGDAVERQIFEAKTSAITEVLSKMGVQSKWGNISLSEEFRKTLHELIAKTVKGRIDQAIHEHVTSEETKAWLNRRVEYAIEQRFNRALDEAVSARLQQIKDNLLK